MTQGEQERSGDQAFCPNCGRSMPPNLRFCPYCGQRTESNPGFCSHCGTSIAPGSSFCTSCGSSTAVATARPSDRGAVAMAETEYMGFWIRLAAAVIDGIIIGIIGGIIDAITGVPYFSYILSLLYYVLFIGLKGQTPGKMALGIQVVTAQHEVPGVPRAILREVLGKLVSTVVILLGFFWIGWDRHKRGWHDHISGTYVIRKRRIRP